MVSFTISDASLFVGTGGQLNAGRTAVKTTAGAVGFLVSGANFAMATVTMGTTSFTGLEVTVTNAALIGVSAMDLRVSGAVKLNQTSVVAGPRINWVTATNSPTTRTA